MLNGKMGNFGTEKVKNSFDWQQGYGGGGCIGESSQGKMGGNEGKWVKLGESVGNFGCLIEKWGILGPKRSKNMVLIGNKVGGGGPEEKWGEMGENGETKPVHPSPTVFVICPPPVFPHPPPPFSTISPHSPPFFLALGTLRVRCWVYYGMSGLQVRGGGQ